MGHFGSSAACEACLSEWSPISPGVFALLCSGVRTESSASPGHKGRVKPPGLLAPHMLWGFRGCEKVVWTLRYLVSLSLSLSLSRSLPAEKPWIRGLCLAHQLDALQGLAASPRRELRGTRGTAFSFRRRALERRSSRVPPGAAQRSRTKSPGWICSTGARRSSPPTKKTPSKPYGLGRWSGPRAFRSNGGSSEALSSETGRSRLQDSETRDARAACRRARSWKRRE